MQHNFKLYKSGKHWVYAGSIMLAVAGGIVLINNPTAEADMVADNANVSTSVGSQSASPSSTMILASVATSEASSASATSNASYSNSQSATSLASSEVGSVASSTSASLSSSSSESVATTSSSASSSASSLVNTSSLSSSVSAIKLAVAARTMRTQAALVAPTIIDSGVWGTAPWILDSNGLLTIGKTVAGVVTKGTIQAYDRPAQFSPSGTDGALIKAVVVASGANIILDGTTYAPGVPAGQIAPQLFTGLANLVNVDLTGMTASSNVSTLNDMFAFDYNLANVVIPKGIVTQNVTSLNGMFRGDKTLTNIDLSNFDTSNVTNMAHMFDLYDPTLTSTTTPEPSSLTLNLTSFDTSKVTDMSNMFNDLPIYSLDLSNFNTANVTNMSYMFVGTHLRALDLSNFNTTKVTNMVGMFAGNSVLSNINLSSFDTSNVTDMSFIFSDDDFLQSIDISNFSSKSLNNFGTNGMFQDSPELQEIKLGSNWSFSPDGSPHEWGNSPLKGVVPWLGRYGYAPTLNADGTISSGGMSIQTYPRITAPDQQNGYFTGLWQELGNSTNILQPNGQVITNEGLVNLPVGSATGTWVVQHMPVTFLMLRWDRRILELLPIR